MSCGKKLFKKTCMLALVACMLLGMTVTGHADLADVQAVADSVLQMNFTVKDDVGKEYKVPSGTCFLINEDTVLTCYHVINPDYVIGLFTEFYGTEIFGQLNREQLVEKINKSVTYSVTVARDVTVNATYLNGSQSMDFAIMKLAQPIKGRNYISLRSSKDVKAAENVYALGFPEISDAAHEVSTYTRDDVTFSSGVVSKVQDLYTFNFDDGDTFKGQFIQTTCMINSGNSGGPMVDANGYAVGLSSVSQNDSFFYGVAIDQVIEVLDALGVKYTKADETTKTSEIAQPEQPTATQTPTEPAPVEAPTVKLDALQSVLSKANEIDEKSYTKESYDALWTAMSEAKKAVSSGDQSAIDNATDNLERALKNLEAAKSGSNMLYIIIAAVAAVVVIILVVVLVSANNKKKVAAAKNAARPKAPAYTTPPAGGTSGFSAAPATPARPTVTSAPASDPGATTILQGKVEATTVLANGGTLTRVKNGDRLDIRVQEILVGRDSNVCSFWISGNSNIGRKHAKFSVKGGTTYVMDCNSTNGTFVNGTKLQPNVEVALKDGDKITLADEDFKFTK